MARSTRAKAEVERGGLELFAAKGVDGVSIGEIASLAGVSQGALYRHYPSKQDLAWGLFSTAYLRTAAELDEIRRGQRGFRAQTGAMAAHFCALYDRDPALFRFMLIAQHNLLPRVRPGQRTPVDEVADTRRGCGPVRRDRSGEPTCRRRGDPGCDLADRGLSHLWALARRPLAASTEPGAGRDCG